MSSDKRRTLILGCDCLEPAFIRFLKFTPYKGDPSEELYISVVLNHYLPWYKRIGIAFKYVFGSSVSPHKDHFAELIINHKDQKSLHSFLEEGFNETVNFQKENA